MTGPVLVLAGGMSHEEWQAARQPLTARAISASEIAIVMGLSSWSSPYALYFRKTGALPDQDDNVDMELGRYLEDYVVAKFAGRHPEFAVTGDGQAIYAHPDRPWQLATPDRLLEDGPSCGIVELDGVFVVQPLATLEAKTSATYDEWGDDGTDEIPVAYRCQKLWQMDVMGVTTGYVACLFLHSKKVRVYELTMDGAARADLKIMRAHAELFLDRIGRGDPPGVDWRPATTGALKALHPAIEDRDVEIRRMPGIQYRAACRRYKEAGQHKKLAENRLRELLGNGHRVVDRVTGDVIATRQVYGVKEHVRKASVTDKLVPARAPEGQ
jgi:putative phage-type endonuclease